MNSNLIAIIGNDERIITMINYIFYKGTTRANYTDFIFEKGNLPDNIESRILYTNTLMDNIFSELFSINKNLFNSNDWYDFKNHKCLKQKEINVHNERIYNEELVDLSDINTKLGFSINEPIIKISELRKIFERVIKELFGNTYYFTIIKKANDISIAKELCIIVGFDSHYEFNTFKQTFPFTGNVIDITGNSNYNRDYYIPTDMLEKDSVGNFKEELKIFYRIKEIIKFILL